MQFLRKLSKSGYEDNLILKGGLFIYTLTNFESRATIDVDFLLRAASNSIEDVKGLIGEIIITPTGNDYIAMTAKGFEEISPKRKYHGISAQIIAQIKNVRVLFNVDIGVGDVGNIRFGERRFNLPTTLTPTTLIERDEMPYISALLEAYSDELNISIDTTQSLEFDNR